MNKVMRLMVLILVFTPISAIAEFYKYVDQNGNVNITDDVGKIPESQRPKLPQKTDITADKVVVKHNPNRGLINPSPDLVSAALRGDQAEVKRLLSQGVDINKGDAAGYTALIHAAARSGPDMVLLLLDHGADINAKATDRITPLLNSLTFYDKKMLLS